MKGLKMLICPSCGKTEKDYMTELDVETVEQIKVPIVDIDIELENNTMKEIGFCLHCYACGNRTESFKSLDELKDNCDSSWLIETF
jgi:DNA-directed RNA polymerase subunit M/transcription elongation factor TFIIS